MFFRVKDILVLVIILTIYEANPDVKITLSCKDPVLDNLVIEVVA